MPAPAVSFQSRYRAASHFRKKRSRMPPRARKKVSISLSSGFSFQGYACPKPQRRPAPPFQSRYRAASHFRFIHRRTLLSGIIEIVSISLSSGFSFQVFAPLFFLPVTLFGFNLVIERLLISGRLTRYTSSRLTNVSISLSSGFSFQGGDRRNGAV